LITSDMKGFITIFNVPLIDSGKLICKVFDNPHGITSFSSDRKKKLLILVGADDLIRIRVLK